MINDVKSFLFLILVIPFGLFSQNTKEGNNQIDSSLYYYNKVLKPETKSNLIDAFTYYKNQKEHQLKNRDTTNAIYSLRQIAIIQNELGMLHDSEKSSIEALRLLENHEVNAITNESKVGIYNRLGKTYRSLMEYDKANAYYDKALQLTSDQKNKTILKNNIGYAYLRKGDLNNAEVVLLSVYDKSKAINDSVNLARSADNLGIVYSKLQDNRAWDYLSEALNIRLKLDSPSDIMSSYYDIAEHFKRHDNFEEANFYAQKALDLAQVSNNPKELMAVLGLLVSLKPDKDVRKYKELQDSMQQTELIYQGKYTSKKYDLEKQQQLAAQRLLEIEKQKSYKIIYGLLALLIGLMAFFIFIFLKSKYQKEKEIEIANTELRISKKVHDEVANDVYHIMNKMQHKVAESDTVLDDLETVYNKTRDISREYNDIKVEANFKEVLLDLLSSYNSQTTNVIVSGLSKINWDNLSVKKKKAIYRVLQELMINMKKHSHATLVAIAFKIENKQIIINYKDNGVGTTLKKQNGLLNTENRIFSLNGSITFKTEINKGFKVLMKV
ncbi:tetratricopeptide repeat-containing sensor histidine kinase [Hanstruepera ponticola]|uniref:tetratricopeptide repeat-containing sensor histidine kinase n=1 Tax=Hanstruepera ponticola TaxID=2042995 RepID=UPI00177F91FE|nr:tetratricopeptide repeat protein [Hanstruepera ponticola]